MNTPPSHADYLRRRYVNMKNLASEDIDQMTIPEALEIMLAAYAEAINEHEALGLPGLPDTQITIGSGDEIKMCVLSYETKEDFMTRMRVLADVQAQSKVDLAVIERDQDMTQYLQLRDKLFPGT